MTRVEQHELSHLSQQFDDNPFQLSEVELNRFDELVALFADDPDIQETQRLASVLSRAVLKWWRMKHPGVHPPGTPAPGTP